MIYVLYMCDYEDFEMRGVFDGPKGVDVEALCDQFHANFDHRTLGRPEYPKYNGPLEQQPIYYGSVCSGSVYHSVVGSGCLTGAVSNPTPFRESPQYKAWEREYVKVRDEWNAKREEKLALFQQKYPGETLETMFISFLRVEYGFKDVDCRCVNI